MDAPRSRWSIVPAAFGLAWVQQALFFVITSALGQAPEGAARNWGVTAVFVFGGALLNTGFYCATWLGLIGAARVAPRLRMTWLVGLSAGLFFFTLANTLGTAGDPHNPFPGYAQMAVLVITLGSAFRVDDARSALAPTQRD